MNQVSTPQARLRAGVARGDITPPVGIYHRMWGAATHDRATGIHRPLLATALWLEPRVADPASAQLLVTLDHCILERDEMQAIRQAAGTAAGLDAGQVYVALSHTHGAGYMSRTRAHLPGGELIRPYLDSMRQTVSALAATARQNASPATIVYGTGRCALAAHRDFLDPQRKHFVCGLNPDGPADDTLLVARLTTDDGKTCATLVNYACHPTILAWDNTLISPDWVGALRETVENATDAPCLFLQGASGDLGPREGYVGDVSVADRNGRQVGHAALAVLEGLPPPGTRYEYAGAVLSGCWIGTWRHVPLPDDALRAHETWRWRSFVVELPYRAGLPTLEQTHAERERWQQQEAEALAGGDAERARDCRANSEQMTRQAARLAALPPGRGYPLSLTVARLGDALWVFSPGELYHVFQTALRQRLAPRPVIVSTITNDWQPGYIPAATAYGHGIYQDIIAAVAQGSLEQLLERTASELKALS